MIVQVFRDLGYGLRANHGASRIRLDVCKQRDDQQRLFGASQIMHEEVPVYVPTN